MNFDNFSFFSYFASDLKQNYDMCLPVKGCTNKLNNSIPGLCTKEEKQKFGLQPQGRPKPVKKTNPIPTLEGMEF